MKNGRILNITITYSFIIHSVYGKWSRVVQFPLYILFSFSDREVRLSEYLCVLKTVSVQQLELCQKYNLPKKGKAFIFLSSIKTISLNILYPQFFFIIWDKDYKVSGDGEGRPASGQRPFKKHGEIHCKKCLSIFKMISYITREGFVCAISNGTISKNILGFFCGNLMAL